MKQQNNNEHKAIIETIINTAAIALTATGTAWVVNDLSHGGLGFVLIIFGVMLEFLKYFGRKHKYW